MNAQIFVGLPEKHKAKFSTSWTQQEFFEHIADVITNHMGVPPFALKTPCRERLFVDARKLFCYIVRNKYKGYIKTPPTFHQIGAFMNKDHATVLYGERRAIELIETDDAFNELVSDVLKKLKK